MPKSADAPRSGAFLDLVRRFDRFGAATMERSEGGIPYLVNEFWTAGQRRGHSLHEISYRACFKPALAEFFITNLSAPGDGVLDPFMGRGTTPIEAALLGRRPLGQDINPLALLLARPRLNPPAWADIGRRLGAVPWEKTHDFPEELLAFYHPETVRKLAALRAWLARVAPLAEENPDPCADWIRMVALNRLSGHSPGFFSVYTLPPNQAASVASQRRINARRGQTPPARDVPALILKKTSALLRDGAMPAHPPGRLAIGRADDLAAVATGSVTLIVTSPPFLDVVHYANDNWLRLWFGGIEAGAVRIDMHRGEAAWQAMVRRVLAEAARVLRPGGHVAFEVGEVRGGRVLLEQAVWRAAEGLPFARLAVLVNQQAFTKTAQCWGVSNNAGGTNTNRVVLLRRTEGCLS